MHLQNNTLLHGDTYKIIRFINSGGFGCTYEAEHVMLGRRVAIKEFFIKNYCKREADMTVSVATDNNKALVGRLQKKFIDEAKILSRFNHPGIVHVTDVFCENGTAYYVMDYIKGHSLSEIVKDNGTLSERRALKYIREVSSALKYVHGNNRLHMDVKPGNIMIDGSDHAVLIDFGASKHYSEETGENTSTLTGINTPGYAPVEQINRSNTTFSPSTDIYALGATLYTLLTGITPPNSVSLLSEEETLTPLPSVVSQSTRRAVEKAMQLKRSARPQSIGEFLNLFDEEKVYSIDEATVLGVDGKPDEKQSSDTGKQAQGYTVSSSVGGSYRGHGYVDLGLPSGLKWAAYNVGSSSPEEYGNYYAWGETSTKSGYTKENSITHKKNIGDISGLSQYDAARYNWGGNWRIPTKSEIKELTEHCDYKWITYKGKKGVLFTSRKNGKKLFLPAVGRRCGASFNEVGEYGYYWSSTPYEDGGIGVYTLFFYANGNFGDYWYRRYDGRSVRPVSE